MRGSIEHRRRARRGKAEPRNTAAESSSERGAAAKKQIFARALKRVNARLIVCGPTKGEPKSAPG
jgi:hypothetical protein